jgi:hypothetical protein
MNNEDYAIVIGIDTTALTCFAKRRGDRSVPAARAGRRWKNATPVSFYPAYPPNRALSEPADEERHHGKRIELRDQSSASVGGCIFISPGTALTLRRFLLSNATAHWGTTGHPVTGFSSIL